MRFLVLVLVALSSAAPDLANADEVLTPDQILKAVDEQVSFKTDYSALVRVREKRKDGTDMVTEIRTYRRDSTKDFILVVTQPPQTAGAGLLRVDSNIWSYDPTVGQWRRSTRRARVTSTVACESDFDRSTLAEDYHATDEGTEKLEGGTYRKLLLKAKPGKDPVYLMMRLWVDAANNVAKRIGYAQSGAVLRLDIIKSYGRVREAATGRSVTYPKEIEEYADSEGVSGVVRFEAIDIAPLAENIFTKAWLEGRAR